MKKKLIGISILGLMMASLLSSNNLKTSALDNYVDVDGITHYGWNLVANETNAQCFEFDEDGNLDYIYAAEGDTANQRVWNYALRNLEIEGNDSYTIGATFTPDPETDLSAERCYGIVCWYQDADNYLIYWNQQKPRPEWSGQFYGRIDGAFRKYYIPQTYCAGSVVYCDYWRKGEYEDFWWDCQRHANPEILQDPDALCSTTVRLEVKSAIETITVNSKEETCRSFELHQIVNTTDHIVAKVYVEQLNAESGNFYTGIYSEAFNVGISNFDLNTTNTDFVDQVEKDIDNTPTTIEDFDSIVAIMNSREKYENLLDLKANVNDQSLTKLEDAESAVASYIDDEIAALDDTIETFKTDVTNAYNLYDSVSPFIQDKVSKLDDLVAAVREAQTWEYQDPDTLSESSSEVPSPNSSEAQSDVESDAKSDIPSEVPSPSSSEQLSNQDSKSDTASTTPSDDNNTSKKGCGGNATNVGIIFGLLTLGAYFLIKRLKRNNI